MPAKTVALSVNCRAICRLCILGVIMGEKWAHAPVFCALAQVRHNPVWQIGEYRSKIQEALRQTGCPDARMESLALVRLPAPAKEPGAPPMAPRFEQVPRIVCADRDGIRAWIVDPDKLTYCTSEYETFERFRDQFLEALAPVQAILKLEYVDQVSARYLDAVVPPDGELGLSNYLVPEVLGLTPHISHRVTIRHAECLVQFQTEEHIEVNARTRIQSGRIALPPDLQPLAVRIAERFTAIEGVHAILDTDALYRERQAFEIKTLRTLMAKLRGAVGIAFDATVTRHARSAWKK